MVNAIPGDLYFFAIFFVVIASGDSLCSPTMRSGTCTVHYVMHCKRLSIVETETQGEIEIQYVKRD